MGISICGTKGMLTASDELQLRNNHSFLYQKTTYLSLLHNECVPNVVEELSLRHHELELLGLLELVAEEYRDVGKLRKRILEVCVSSSSSSSSSLPGLFRRELLVSRILRSKTRIRLSCSATPPAVSSPPFPPHFSSSSGPAGGGAAPHGRPPGPPWCPRAKAWRGEATGAAT